MKEDRVLVSADAGVHTGCAGAVLSYTTHFKIQPASIK